MFEAEEKDRLEAKKFHAKQAANLEQELKEFQQFYFEWASCWPSTFNYVDLEELSNMFLAFVKTNPRSRAESYEFARSLKRDLES